MVQASGPPVKAVEQVWEDISRRDQASWYLDPLVAEQKRKLNAALVQDLPPQACRIALKTDAFEEAFGDDSPLADLLPLSDQWLVVDASAGLVQKARARRSAPSVRFVAADVRHLPLCAGCLDLVFSNSTLDHFDSSLDFDAAVLEIARVLRPNGRLIITVDNPLNPGYWLLRWFCKFRFAPFPLGYSPGPARLRGILEESGFVVAETGVLIHNPRGFSTVLFLALRKLLGRRANGPIRLLLAAFEWMGRLPTRRFTACYLTAHAIRRG